MTVVLGVLRHFKNRTAAGWVCHSQQLKQRHVACSSPLSQCEQVKMSFYPQNASQVAWCLESAVWRATLLLLLVASGFRELMLAVCIYTICGCTHVMCLVICLLLWY